MTEGKIKPGKGQECGRVGGRRAGSLPSAVIEGSAEKVIFEQRLRGGGTALWLSVGWLLGGGHCTGENPGSQDWRVAGTTHDCEEGAECETGREEMRWKVTSQCSRCQRGNRTQQLSQHGSY